MRTVDFNRGPAAHRYWSEVVRRDAGLRALIDDWDVQRFLSAQGLRLDEHEPRGGSRRFSWRPWRDWLHLHRAGSNSVEAKRWNADLANFRRMAALPIEASDGLVVYVEDNGLRARRSKTNERSLNLDREFGLDITMQRAYIEFLQSGSTDADVTARGIKERRRRWMRRRR